MPLSHQAAKRLVNRRTRTQVQKLLGRQQAALGQGLRVFKNGLNQLAHGGSQFVRSLTLNLTNYKESGATVLR
jgi:hypothetical protein